MFLSSLAQVIFYLPIQSHKIRTYCITYSTSWIHVLLCYLPFPHLWLPNHLTHLLILLPIHLPRCQCGPNTHGSQTMHQGAPGCHRKFIGAPQNILSIWGKQSNMYIYQILHVLQAQDGSMLTSEHVTFLSMMSYLCKTKISTAAMLKSNTTGKSLWNRKLAL